VYCLNATTGVKLWSFATGDSISSSPSIAGGRVYVGSDDARVYCLNALTGAHAWNYTTGDAVVSTPAIAGGRVYVGSNDGKEYCLNALTGALVWNFTTIDCVESSAAILNGRVYVGSDDNTLYCLDAATGVQVWSYITGGMVCSSPAIAGGYLFVGSYDCSVYCLPLDLGFPAAPRNPAAVTGDGQISLTWSTPGNNGGHAITGYRVYRGTSPGNLTLIATLGNVTAYIDTGLMNGQTYYYKVTAVNSIGESTLSVIVAAIPAVPGPSSIDPTPAVLVVIIAFGAGVVLVVMKARAAKVLVPSKR
jgi:WD40 repeat protein